MNAFTRDVEALLDTIDRLRAQHRAGLTPAFGELDDLFEQGGIVRSDLAALDAGLVPPPAAPGAHRGRLTLERVEGGPVRMAFSVGQAARTLLETLPAAAGATR